MLSRMTPFLRALPALLVALFLAGCGSMSDFDQPEVPPPPPPPPASLAVSADATAEASAEGSAADADEFEDTDASALTDFHATLSPYGSWADDATYGTVWVPSTDVVGADFSPYATAGHWELNASNDWLWVSDYDPTFGWVVFHYGRWVWTGGRGWVWIPGRRYAPAWVVWRTGDPGYDYIGWAPAPPLFYWRGGSVFYFSTYPRTSYFFCPSAYVFHHNVYHHVITGPRADDIGRQTHVYSRPRPNGPNHAYTQPSRGPAVGEYVPAHVRPSVRPAHAAPEHHAFSTPSGMGRRPPPSVTPGDGGGRPRVASPSDGSGRPRVTSPGSRPPAPAFAGRDPGDSRPAPRVTTPASVERPSALPSAGFRDPPRPGRPLPSGFDSPRSAGPRVETPSSRPGPIFQPSRPSASPVTIPSRPSYSPSPSRPSYSPSPRPSYSPSPSRPSFSSPSRPSFSSPSRPSFSSPSRPSVSSPSRSFSRPSVSPSRRR
jgi:uncharacterized protein DUF6600